MGSNRAAGGVRLVAASTDDREASVFRAHAAPRATCENLTNAREAPDKSAEGWRQSSWDNCHRFVGEKPQQDHGRAQELHLRKQGTCTGKQGQGKWQSQSPRPQELLSEKVRMNFFYEHVRKVCCAPSLTHRTWETKGGGLPLVDADWHAFCQATFHGVEGPEWEAMYHHHKNLNQAVKSVLWAIEEAKERGDKPPKKKFRQEPDSD